MGSLRVSRVVFWRAVFEGLSVERAAGDAGVAVTTGRHWMREAGGVIPQRLLDDPSGRFLDATERAVIMVARRDGKSVRAIAAILGRSPSTVSRELKRNRRKAGVQSGRQ